MKRAILTLLAAGVLVPLAAGTALAGPKRSRKDVKVKADRGGISIEYEKVERNGRSHDRWRHAQRSAIAGGGVTLASRPRLCFRLARGPREHIAVLVRPVEALHKAPLAKAPTLIQADARLVDRVDGQERFGAQPIELG